MTKKNDNLALLFANKTVTNANLSLYADNINFLTLSFYTTMQMLKNQKFVSSLESSNVGLHTTT